MKKKGLIFVISASSGAGKTTLIREFLRSHKRDFVLSVSVTTRAPRGSEKDGRDYYFFTKSRFLRYVKKGSFLEHARVLSNYYGTLKKTVINAVNKGKNVIMDIDVQGAEKIRRKMRDKCVTIFIVPSRKYFTALAWLKSRLSRRRTESVPDMQKRLALAKKEWKERRRYDYILVNRNLKAAARKLEEIYRLESSRRNNKEEA